MRDSFRLRWDNLGIPLPYRYRGFSCWMSRENWPTVLLGYNYLLITHGRIATVHLGYNDVLIPQGRIAISKISLYPEKFTEGTGIIDSMGPNRNKEDIIISPIVITRVDCISKISLYPERLAKGTGIIDSMGPNRNKEDIVIPNRYNQVGLYSPGPTHWLANQLWVRLNFWSARSLG